MVDNVRWRNKDSLREYLLHPTGCREEIQRLDRKEQMEEFMFLGLRMAEGVDARRFEELFGEKPETVYGDVIEKNKKDGLLVRDEGSGDRIFLTERGLDLSNYVMAQFLL
jgi:oxygen-independent coproporphyrinogen-3 oxidase